MSPSQLPFDIICDILRRLPAKSLMQFKCVCKEWLNIICDPRFSESHLSYSWTRPEASYILFLNNTSEIFATNQELFYNDSQLPNRFPSHKPCSNVVNGLICMRHIFRNHIMLFNLTTGEKRYLPNTALRGHQHSYALGFDPISSKYKVLHFAAYNLGEEGEEGCEVLTIGSKSSWRKLADSTPTIFTGTVHAMYIGGRIYFKKHLRINDQIVRFFDLTTEKFGMIAAPEGFEEQNSFNYLVEVEGNLGFVSRDYESDQTIKSRIWVLGRNGCDWVERGIIALSRDDVRSPQLKGIVCTGEILLQDLSNCGRKFVLYDIKTSTYKITQIINRPCNISYQVPIRCNHVENILPLSSIE